MIPTLGPCFFVTRLGRDRQTGADVLHRRAAVCVGSTPEGRPHLYVFGDPEKDIEVGWSVPAAYTREKAAELGLVSWYEPHLPATATTPTPAIKPQVQTPPKVGAKVGP